MSTADEELAKALGLNLQLESSAALVAAVRAAGWIPGREAVKMLRNSYAALLEVHAAVRMDTDEDRDLHRRAIEEFTQALRVFDALCPDLVASLGEKP